MVRIVNGVFLIKKGFEGSIDYVQVMDENSNIDMNLFPKDVTDAKILDMYKTMSMARALDAKALSLQRQGRAVTYAPTLGQEGTQIGAAFAMGENDWFVPNFRQHAVFVARGYPLDKIMLYWRGFEESLAIPPEKKTLAVIVPVATQLPHAVGVAYAQKYKNTGSNVVTYVGDGGTSEGQFYESMNFAGVYKLPLVMVIENNQWAISMPRGKQSAATTLAQKAIAAGIPGIQVDGNDVIGVYKVIKDALAAASDGPTVVECITYRLSMHTTADDPTKYRNDQEVAFWKQRDPLMRIKNYLVKKSLWNDNMENELADANLKKIDEAVEKSESFKPDPQSMFKNVYSYMPDVLEEELDEASKANFWQ